MSLNVSFANIDEWKAILQAIADITDEAMFICDRDRITFRGMDPSHVALLEITFPKSSFKSFDCEATFFGIYVKDMANILSVASKEDTVEFKINDPHSMQIRIAGLLDMRYVLNLVSREKVNLSMPRIHSKSKISMSSETLFKIVSNIEKVSDYITISTKPETIRFAGDGLVGNVHMDMKKTDSQIFSFDVQEDSLSAYSLEYMSKIIQNIRKAGKKVNIEYGMHTPIYLRFEMESQAKAEYYLASRAVD